ncbi:flagellar hook-length control protein FliK [Desulfitobacterium sp.]|uniref:flagellar hook-length control protein FliK n=1 Tax=Desulfitobacterium sp. TaxID=49981 RepID=UPI002C75D5EB|nr:flagellar hook-length control protein FliK [Desulfitobacterium sp.]HVJ49564.1 flagellar hook-length control protein FliK [Desulfitobacterium sp.]
MSEINVLVSGNATPQVKDGVVSTEKNSGPDSAAMEFAAILGGWMAQALGQGQDSGLQSSDPAGKEANSGQTGFQGLEGMLGSLRMIAGLNLGSASGQNQQGSDALMKAISPEIMTLLSQGNLQGDVTGPGMGSGQLQGGKSPLTELDQYRVLITQLLQDMSGEISKVSYKPTDIQGLLTQLSQELNLNTSSINADQSNFIGAKLNVQSILGQLVESSLTQNTALAQTQPSFTQTVSNSLAVSKDQVPSETQIMNSNDIQKGIQSKASEQVTNVAQVVNLSAQSKEAVQSNPNIEKAVVQNLNPTQNIPLAQTQNTPQPGGLPTGNHLLHMNIQTETGQSGTGNEKKDLSGNGNITNSKASKTEGTNSTLGNFNLANLTLISTADVGNKTRVSSNLPIWQQVAQELQANVLHQLPTIRELNIQLHPAELGQISINLTWDNGQVNMQMKASEAATGQILQNNFAELRESLSQSGVQCGMMQMGLSDSNQNFNQGRNQTFSSQSKNQNNQESNTSLKLDDVRLDVLPTYGLDQGLTQNNRINVTA